MPPRVILIRHGQALHNPALTSKGEAQCKQLALDIQNKYAFPKEETLIVVSPLRRTLQSYHHGLSWLAEEGIRVELRAEWQETTANPCDVGSEISVISKEWPQLDFSQLDPVYPAKTGLYDASQESLLRRARVARQWLFHRPEKFIIVMTHSGFIRRVVPDCAKYANAEYRTYDFATDEDDADEGSRPFRLIELEAVHQSLSTQQPSIK